VSGGKCSHTGRNDLSLEVTEFGLVAGRRWCKQDIDLVIWPTVKDVSPDRSCLQSLCKSRNVCAEF